jgi:hypothetical protein
MRPCRAYAASRCTRGKVSKDDVMMIARSKQANSLTLGLTAQILSAK